MQVFQKVLPLLFCILLPAIAFGISEREVTEKHVMVAMRMIGHEVLMSLEDCTSRVMPISRRGNQYQIPFENEFEIDPDEVYSVISVIMDETKIASHYFVEVLQCDSKKIMHSFEIGNPSNPNMMACRGRVIPRDCYTLVVTLMDGPGFMEDVAHNMSDSGKDAEFETAYLIVPGVFLLGFLGFYMKKKNPSEEDPNLIKIGATQFDKRNMVLSHKDQQVELSSKEAELLEVLNESLNEPLERETILREVWGDEGDYVGRTLDVFISKLRKKLEADISLKIVNIRGVGYKLVTDVPA